MTQTRLRDCYGHYNTKSRDSLSARRFRTAPRAGSLNPRGVSQGLRRRKDLFPLQGVLQKPDIGDSFEPADHPSGGGPVACAVVPGKGKVENQQVPGPDLPLQKLPSFSQRYPRKIQKREIDGGISDELCKQRACHLAVPGNQRGEAPRLDDAPVVRHPGVLRPFMRKPAEANRTARQIQPLNRAGKGDLPGKFLLRKHKLCIGPKLQRLPRVSVRE